MKGNVDGNIAHLRDTFLLAEKDYIKELIKIPEVIDLIAEIGDYSSDDLFETAQAIIESVEAGEFSDDEMEKIELQLTVILAAIRDKVLIKELTLMPSGAHRSR